ncbi:phosphotransferase [Pseudoramibacter porci]|nr:phosphotransferase [Pseudoramibacter porci]
MAKDAITILQTEEQIDQYLKERGIFSKSCRLVVEDLRKVKESAEGFVNLIYRVRGSDGRSVVIKQILDVPVSRQQRKSPDAYVSSWQLDQSRMQYEIAALIFWNQIHPGICPEIYLLDRPNGVIVMEDLSDLSLLRFEFARFKKYPRLGRQLGAFLADNLFYSSALNMTEYRRQTLLQYFDNPEVTALYTFLFKSCVIVSPERAMPDAVAPLRQRIIDDEGVQTEIKRLSHLFTDEKECLIHTDLHASNIMIDENHLKIIDGEFAGFGPIAQDFGRLCGSFVLDYCSLFGESGQPKEKREDYQRYLLDMLSDLFTVFEKEFKKLIRENIPHNYNLRKLDVDAYLNQHFADALSFTALNAASRLSDWGLVHDFKILPVAERIYPEKLVLASSQDILSRRVQPARPEDWIDFLRELPNRYPKERL